MSLYLSKTTGPQNLLMCCLFIFCFSFMATGQEQKEVSEYVSSTHPTKIIYPTNFFVSKPVRDLPVCDDLVTFDGLIVPKDGVNTSEDMSDKRKRKLAYLNAAGASSTSVDPLIQGPNNYIHSTENRAPIVNFESLGLNVSPPDPSMAVGPNHIVTMENGQWAVYDKLGVMAASFPKLLTDPLSAPGSTANAGDPVVMYDRVADRWFISQFQLPGNDVFLVGVSTTADPTGSYNVYEYNLGAGNDYPHYGVWGDSYVTAGNFTGAQKVYTFNRAKMLAGDGTAEIVGFSPSGLGTAGFAAPIPVHSEAAGAATGDIKIVFYQDDAFSGVTSDHIGLWNIDMDWSDIPGSTISGKNQIPTAAFDAAIAGGFSNLQQPGTGQRIDAIVGAVMNMSHWYQFGTHESILLNWVVETVDGTQISGIRWVELRSTNGGTSWSVYQEGTFTDPTGSESVFMGCISMDALGNIGLGYTKTGSTTFPSLYYTGRMDGDALGSMTVTEELAIAGTTSITANDRYGDYGQAVRDPVDDLTFWVTSEYSGDPDRRVRVYSFKIAPSAPQIGFTNTAVNAVEDADLCFTDISVPLDITIAPSDDAIVSFVISGASTTTTGLDFELLTPSVTFTGGATAPQNMMLRVYHDGLVESDETIVVDFNITTIGDAEANLNQDSFTLTIQSTDVAPVAAQNSILFSDDFESYSDFAITPVGPWTMLDNDGDQAYGSATYDFPNENYTGTFIVFNPSQTIPTAAGTDWDPHGGSKGYYCFAESIAPFLNDDYIFTPQISLSGTGSELKFWARSLTATFGLDRFQVGVSTTDTSPGSFTIISAAPYVEPPTAWTEYTFDLSAYDGDDIYITFHVVSADSFVFMLDDVSVTSNTKVGVQTAVNNATSESIQINGLGTAYAYDDLSGNVMADITNNNSHDYDCVDVHVSRAGTSAQSYNGSGLPDFVTDKTFDILPFTTTGSGNTDITFYFTEAEILGWEMAAGDVRANLVAARGNASSVTETSALTIGSFGSDVTLTGTFTGLDGTYYFGPIAAFNLACSGAAKIWDGANWNGGGTPPTVANTVTIDGPYDTNLHGNIDGCSLTVNLGNQLTVRGGGYVRVNGNILVDGSLVVEHQGSVVQTDAITSVTNNGTINVLQSTPNLASRDFMILGSPMTGETRTSVWNAAFIVLDATTLNFVPHPQVAIDFPGAENFADDNNNYWQFYNGAQPINPGEGYLVRPQAGYGQPGGVFNYTYDDGTLNSGDVTFNVGYNTPGPTGADNKNASPNALANPYPSAIFADDFINGNAMVDEVYFWEHLTPPNPLLPGAGSMNFSMEDISIYNLMGGTPAGNPPVPATTPNGFISTGQGFGIKATAGGTATFTNAMRRTSGNTTLRGANDKDRIWLNITNEAYEMGGSTLIGFTENATAGRDNGYDSRRLATVLSIYSHLEDGSEQLGIQSRESFESGMQVPVGFSTQIDAPLEYKISIMNIEGENLDGATVYLIDHYTNTVTNLSEEAYAFTSEKGTFHGRFTLQFEGDPVLDSNDNLLDSVSIFPNPTDGMLNIVSPMDPITAIEVFDMRGRLIQAAKYNSQNSIQLDINNLQSSVYFVQLNTVSGNKLTKRVVKR